MNLKGKIVKHIVFGIGTITRHKGDEIIIKFGSDERYFKYPQSFDDGYLELENSLLTDNRIKNIKAKSEKRTNLNRYNKQENVAIKCIYNDGGNADAYNGFRGVCSDENIKSNIASNRVWCSQPQCPCNRYINKIISRDVLEYINKTDMVCHESRLLIDWKGYAGFYHNGERKDKPIKINNSSEGALAVFTTRFPGEKEENRYIFAVFIIKSYFKGDDYDCGCVTADDYYRIELSTDEMREMPFWEFYSNSKSDKKKWGSGIIRYFDNDIAVDILKKIIKIKDGKKEKELAENILKRFCEIHNIKI